MVIILFIASLVIFILMDVHEYVNEIELRYPEFNKKKLQYTDFEKICNAENIITWQDKIPWEGWYFKRRAQSFIVINKSLPDFIKRFTAFHELGHYFAHAGRHHFNSSRLKWWRQKKMELQADVIAAVALAPTSLLEDLKSQKRLTGEEIAKICKTPKDFGEFRLKIFKKAHL
jgi:Zn-dependent peptidase ImmA (M78 family)